VSDRSLTRRTVLQTAAVTGIAAAGTGLFASPAAAGGRLPYPDVTDTSHASEKVARILRGFFTAKSRHDPDALMTYFDKKDAFYIDASSGSIWPNWDSLNDVFHAFLPPAPPAALSYPLRIVGDENSALVSFEDTPELFGKELRILGSVTFNRRGKIVRWIDYWDGRSSLRTTSIAPTYPTDFHDSVVNTSPRITTAATRLQNAFAAGDAATATALFSFDAVLEDMAAHSRVQGQLQIGRYLTRALPTVPYGAGASIAHVVGSREGGGYEWHAAASATPMRRGNTAIELDNDGKVSRLTVVYDSGLLTYPAYQSLVMLAAEAAS
jgi:hypothetical protein